MSDTRTDGPLFSIVVVTYDRAAYVGELLASIASQVGRVSHELVLLDNGSPSEVFEQVAQKVAALTCPTTVIRHCENLLSPTRWAEAIAAASGTYVLLPGDDDVLLPDYLATLQRLVADTPEAAIVSGTGRHIDADGRPLGSRSVPLPYLGEAATYADALVRPPYPMPSSGFRRDAVDVNCAPATRTAFDWWLWLQALKHGPAACTDREIVLYRQHDRREANHYTNALNRVDAARMLTAEVTGIATRSMIASWTNEQAEEFTARLLSSPGPMYGDREWGALVQLLVADVLCQTGCVDNGLRLHAEAAAQAGMPMPLGHLQTFTGSRTVRALPRETWLRTPVRTSWRVDCPHLEGWREYLNLAPDTADGPEVVFDCPCSTAPNVVGPVARVEQGAHDAVELGWPVTERSAIALLTVIGTHGREGDQESLPIDIERAIITRFRRFRRSRLGSLAEDAYHRARRGR